MFEGVLYFVLGFLSAALIALMVSPAIWNRAVTLTKRRIESSVPLTLNEIQADKDQLRAEFAMSTRRLELSVEELREKASRQMIEINRKRDELAQLTEESREKIRMVEELETRAAELRSKLADREEAYAKISREFEKTREKLEQRSLELEKLRYELSEAQAAADSKRIELVAKQTSFEDLSGQVSEHAESEQALKQKLGEMETALAGKESEVTSLKNRVEETEKRLARLQKLNADLEAKLQNSERDISLMRETGQKEEDASTDLHHQLMAERQNSTELETKLAKANLRMEALLADASNENVRAAMETLSKEKKELTERIRSLSAERDKLMQEVKAFRDNKAIEWEEERKDNAILRERINDLAAQVTAMTATLEGPESPINAILDEEKPSEPAIAREAEENGAPASLADRIRALQETARVKQPQ